MLQGQRQDISLTATLSDDSVSRVTDGVTWITSAGIEVSEGKVVAMQAGSATLTGSYRGLNSSIDLVVKPAELRELEVVVDVKSDEINLPKGLTKTLTVKGFYSNKEFKDLSNAATLVIDDESIAHLNKQGELVAIKEGNTRVHAEYLSIQSPSIPVVVTAEKLTTLVISADDTIIKGLNTQIHITGEFTDGTQRPFTGEVDWFVENKDTSESSDILAIVQGKATAHAPGTVRVRAQVGSVQSEWISITVEEAKLKTLSLKVDTTSIVPKQVIKYTVLGQYTNGTNRDITKSVKLISDSDTVRVNLSDTIITGKQPGTATITAWENQVSSNPISITVTKAKLTKLMVVQEPTLSIASGLNLTLDVHGTYEYDNDDAGKSIVHTVTPNVTWHSQDPSIIVVDKQSLVGKSPGITQVWCSLGGLESKHFNVKVTDAEALSLLITPKKETTIAGYSVQYQAFATYTDNTDHKVTDRVEWHSENLNKAFFTGNTLKTKHAGQVTIRATLGTLTESTNLTISNAKLEKIKLNQVQDDIPLGQTYKLSGIGIDSLDKEIFLDVNKFNWNTVDNSIVDFISAGEIKAMKEGSTEVTVSDKTDPSIKFSMGINVGPKVLKNISIEFTVKSIINGTDQKVIATGLYSDGTNKDITKEVEWSSDSDAIEIDQDGIALATMKYETFITSVSGQLGDIKDTWKIITGNINLMNEEYKPALLHVGNTLYSLPPSQGSLPVMGFTNGARKHDFSRLGHIYNYKKGHSNYPQFKGVHSRDNSAAQYCKNLSSAGYKNRNNWTLASVNELQVLKKLSLDDKLTDRDYLSNATDTNTMVNLRENDDSVKKDLPNDTLGYVSCVSID